MKEITYALMDVTKPIAPVPVPGSGASREALRRAARKAFKGLPWRGSNEPPQTHR